MSRISLYNFIFSIQYRLITSSFVILGLGGSVLAGYVVSSLYDLKLGFFLGLLLSLITCILTVFLSSIIDFQKINSAYDHIRNHISDPDRRMDCVTFSNEFNEFITTNFKNSIFPIDCSFIKILRHNIVYSSTELAENITQDIKEKIYRHCETRNDLFHSLISISGEQYDLFVVPISFYDNYLGFWGVVRKKTLWSNIQFFRDLLQDVENKLLDDQAASVIKFEKLQIWREFLFEADNISNRISQKNYASMEEYARDILGITIELTNCTAAAMETIYSPSYIWTKHPDADDFDKLHNKFTFCTKNSTPVIHERRNPKIKYVLSVPIIIDDLKGVLYLFDNTKENLEFYRLILSDLANIKIDNDMVNLAQQLGLEPVHRICK
ncbi:hypothetical protein [uncultured Pseudodesulfovibrio sp.]|uniref:hypothetical protein n=1 Tax=uncultured Pseudodesulfovibrio sp. TaxID=2035858 RepID=UPI0029C7D6CD|nr:hypothetical protein [uncultured Pseudodesulfovibrio sp.]